MMNTPERIGRYEVLGRIAQGGMGAVYRAWDPQLDRTIAIKLMIHDSDELRERFSREARSVARLRHRNIVTIFDVGDFEGQPFIAMEYVEGSTLADLIRKKEPLAMARRLELVEMLCDALWFAHQMGIVHRDVKPANAVLDNAGVLKVLDFGLARLGASNVTQTGATMGTFSYMSPEQLIGRSVDHRSDIFSVGAVMYELVSYQQAFPGESGLVQRLATGAVEPLDRLCPGIHPEVVRIVSQAIEIDVARRYQELGTMLKDLQRLRTQLSPDPMGETQIGPTRVILPSRRQPDRDELSRLRAAQIRTHVADAEKGLAAGDFDRVVASCNHVLMLDPDEPRALALLGQAKAALDEREADDWLARAEQDVQRGALGAALAKIDQAMELHPSSSRAADLRRSAEQMIQERARAQQRAAALQQMLGRAHAYFDQGRFRDAAAAASEALALDPEYGAAADLKAQSDAAFEAQVRDAIDRTARETVREARRLFALEQHDAALTLLRRFEPGHDLVAQTLQELGAEADRIADGRRAEMERARQARIDEGLRTIRADVDQEEYGRARDRLQALEHAEGDVPESRPLYAEIDAGETRLRTAERDRQAAEHVAHATLLLANDELDAALSRTDAALAIDSGHAAALALRSKIQERVRADAEHRQIEAQHQARRQAEAQPAAASTPPPLRSARTLRPPMLWGGAAAAVLVLALVIYGIVGRPPVPRIEPPANSTPSAPTSEVSKAGEPAVPAASQPEPAAPPPAATVGTPPASPPAEAEATEKRLVNLRQQARDQVARGQRTAALATIGAGTKVRSGDPDSGDHPERPAGRRAAAHDDGAWGGRGGAGRCRV